MAVVTYASMWDTGRDANLLKPWRGEWQPMRSSNRLATTILAAALVCAVIAFSSPARAQTMTVLHPFAGSDGGDPMAGVRRDAAGNLYGTSSGGGVGRGVVYRLSQKNGAWIYSKLYSFQGATDGKAPQGKVTIGPDGALYGTTLLGGGSGCGGTGCGIVFRLTPPPSLCHNIVCPWTETVLHRFDDDPSQGWAPWSAVTFDSSGIMYGTAMHGGGGCGQQGCGVVFKLTPSGGAWTFSVLYNFNSGDGAFPAAGLTLDPAGNFYGVTAYGGPLGFGNVFRLLRSAGRWTYNSLYSFQDGDDGAQPTSDVVLDPSGNIFGANTQGGANGGVVWELSPSQGAWNFTAIASPYCCLVAGVSRDSSGNLYVVTWSGGQDQVGAIYELSYSDGAWTATNIHSLGDDEGAFPYTDAVLDPSGNLYGTTTSGGHGNDGTVWEFSR